tara:strand:+ start:1334 stop:1861 length:528 start_codon:yes stop_codon:yes gene_type:complete
MQSIEILRLSHRIERDKRLSTHIALTTRAFNCKKLYYSGQKDSSLESSITKINENFGSDFKIEHTKSPENLIKQKKKEDYLVIHLTVYGLPLQKNITKIRNHKKILIIIGSELVPPIYYNLADYNISVTSQPLSELSALTILLHEYFQGAQLNTKFKNAKKRIMPQKKGKLVEGN